MRADGRLVSQFELPGLSFPRVCFCLAREESRNPASFAAAATREGDKKGVPQPSPVKLRRDGWPRWLGLFAHTVGSRTPASRNPPVHSAHFFASLCLPGSFASSGWPRCAPCSAILFRC
jgi:hypothetical protein